MLKFTQLSTFTIAYLDIMFYYYCFIGEMWASVCASLVKCGLVCASLVKCGLVCASGVDNREFDPRSIQTKDYKIGNVLLFW